jgi:hypothetical protein
VSAGFLQPSTLMRSLFWPFLKLSECDEMISLPPSFISVFTDKKTARQQKYSKINRDLFAHELGLQLVAETSQAVFISVKTEIKTWMQRD